MADKTSDTPQWVRVFLWHSERYGMLLSRCQAILRKAGIREQYIGDDLETIEAQAGLTGKEFAEQADFEAELSGWALNRAAELAALRPTPDAPTAGDGPQRKKSAAPGEAETKLRSAMMIHHGYDEGSVGNSAPAKIPDLMELANVSRGAVSGFIKRHFGGFVSYRARCRDTAALAGILRKMEGNTPGRFSGGHDALDHVADPCTVDRNAPDD